MAEAHNQNNSGKRRGPKGPSKYHKFIKNYMANSNQNSGIESDKYQMARRAWQSHCNEEAVKNPIQKKPRGRPRSNKEQGNQEPKRPRGRPRSLSSYLKEFRESYHLGKLSLEEKDYSEFVKKFLVHNQKDLLEKMKEYDSRPVKNRGRPKGSKNKNNSSAIIEKDLQEEEINFEDLGKPEVLENMNIKLKEKKSLSKKTFSVKKRGRKLFL